VFVLDSVTEQNPTVAEVARQREQEPVETMIDLGLETDFDQFFAQPVANEDDGAVLEMMRHPRSAVTFSDSGAHVSQIMDSSLQTHVFSHWVRDQAALMLEEAVRMVTFEPASNWGIRNRGLLREGWAADVCIFDPERIAPLMPEVATDLPAEAKRLTQKADGILATVVNGEVLLRKGDHTGALPGQLLRGPLANRTG